MPNLTTNFSYNKPLVNNATDADLWGGQLNTNWDDVDADLPQTTAAKTSDFNVGATEFNYTYLIDASGGTVTATLPAVSSVFNGFVVRFKAADVSNTVTIDGNGSETIDGQASFTLEAENHSLSLVCDGSNWRITSFVLEEGTSGYALTSNGAGATPTFQRPLLNESYESSEQTISGGTITLAHGLSVKPKLINLILVCKTAEGGYSIGDEIHIGVGGSYDVSGAADPYRGIFVRADATNLELIIGENAGSSFEILNATGTATVTITNSNWRIVALAYT